MQFETVALSGDIVLLKLAGRLDLEGTQAINDRFAITATVRRANIIVDLSEVNFLASIGIRLLLTSARSQSSRGGRLILAAPQPTVRKVLEAAGIDQLIGLVADVETAHASFTG